MEYSSFIGGISSSLRGVIGVLNPHYRFGNMIAKELCVDQEMFHLAVRESQIKNKDLCLYEALEQQKMSVSMAAWLLQPAISKGLEVLQKMYGDIPPIISAINALKMNNCSYTESDIAFINDTYNYFINDIKYIAD